MPKSAAMLFMSVYFLYMLSSTSNVAAEWTDEKLLSKHETTEDTRELLGVLYNVLEKLQNRRMASWERRQSRLPSCNVGDFCTMKKGPRFGQLCDCPRGSKCNHFFLKCL